MRIVQLTPGSGDNFYCENCIRDLALVRALQALGHEVILVPMYLPLRLAEETPGPAPAPLFFGGINVYLQQKMAWFRQTPRWLDRCLDTAPLLRLAARQAGMTRARDLGETTLSMLAGAEGRQKKELDRLLAWLAGEPRPEALILSNALLLGLARPLRERLGVPVSCFLQDEDDFIDGLGEPWSRRVWDAIRAEAPAVAQFFAVSRYYAETIGPRMGLTGDRIKIVPAGLDAAGFAPAAASPRPPAIGFLSRLCRDKGLDLLAEAFICLKQEPRWRDLRLRVMGGMLSSDRAYVAAIRQRLKQAGMAGTVDFFTEFSRAARNRFLQGVSVLAVPERKGEAHGLYVLEGLAAGVPFVQPRNSVFPELLAETGGGILYEPGDVASLTAALGTLLAEPDKARELGRSGRLAVLEKYSAPVAARALVRHLGEIFGAA